MDEGKGYRLSGRNMEEKIIKGFIDVNWKLCTGCRLCEQACSLYHEGKIWPEASRIFILQFDPGPIEIPILCHQCSDHPCIEACPVKPEKAISINKKTGAVVIEQDKCLGIKCGRCAKACHHETAIRFHPETNKAINCDLCDGLPECAWICPSGALSFLPGQTFDGSHYAKRPEKIASDLAYQLFPANKLETDKRRDV
ncbi:MAG: 4Fe-4S dicluster domain-containing protein [Deltaproteobacteria bacterium]|nr:4Fe-4S dicluster domain-containing protein [Deltaproteobacteria bacterium]